MNVTIETLDHRCNQAEDQDCGEILEQGERATLVRKYIISNQRPPKLFLTREDAAEEAVKLGLTVTT